MDCFTDYYEQLERLTAIPEPEVDEYGNPIPVENDMTDLSAEIDESYFNKIDHASSSIQFFYDRYIADNKMHQALHSYVNTRRRKNYDDLKLMLMIDIVRGYEGLNHSTRLNSPEGIALLLVLVKIYRRDYIITYETLNEIPEIILILDGLIPYIANCADQINDIPSENSIISTLLLEAHPKNDRTYRICLYYFFEAVAEADGFISNSEREFLLTLLRLDDNDVTNDIVIESLFNRDESFNNNRGVNESLN